MAQKSAGQSLLENSYGLDTPEDNRVYYDALAQSYDSGFVEELGYSYPLVVAAIYRRVAGAEDRPVLDVGCGTGIVAQGLGLPAEAIDGIDISPEMLKLADAKNIYRRLIDADLTESLDHLGDGYGAVVSAGTFTHGHLGPEPLARLLDVARRGAQFVIGINERHYEAHGFAETLIALERAGRIGALKSERRPIYDKAGHDHSADHALIMLYRKT